MVTTADGRVAAPAVIETAGLTKCFGDVVAVDGLDLAVQRGEVFGFLGPNGAGKTTTIRLVLDFVRPTSGHVRVLGGGGADPSVRARIGYLPADFPIDPRYTADDVVAFYGALRGGVDRPWLDELYDRFSLDATRPAGQLSTGNRRKIGLVQAFVHRPELLILDEPTSGLDPLLQHEFQALVREAVREQGATVLLSSHVLPEVDVLASRVGILRRGRLVTIIRPDELRSMARHRIELTLAEEASADLVMRLRAIETAIDVQATGQSVTVVVEGSVDAVIKVAASVEVSRISTDSQDLEQVFLGFYDEEAKEA